MLISVVTPVLNGAKTIERTLRSVSGQRANFEHIVMDGGSRDETEAIVRRHAGSYPIRYFRQPDRSGYEGLWNGMEKMRGDVIGHINADDFYLPCTLATVAAVFEQHPDVRWITGIPTWHYEDTGATTTLPYAPIYRRNWIRAGYYAPTRFEGLQHESLFWRRSLWEEHRAVAREVLLKYSLAADFNLWRQFAKTAELRTVSAVFACFSVSANQVSRKNREKYLEECGLGGKRPWPARLAQQAMRATSLLLRSRVIVPPQPQF